MSIYKDGKLIAGGRQCMPLLSFMWADHVLNDASWLRADTFSWQSGSVYQAVYAHLTADITDKTLQSETISGTTIQFYLADDGHKICPASEESNVTAIYNATGVAWYYIIDTTNVRFKLPRTKFGFTGLRSVVGGYIDAGLPNITGGIGLSTTQMSSSGAFTHWQSGGAQGWDGWNNYGNRGFNFDASRSSSVYGNSDTVQPKATEMYLYFYVGQFTQTALENTAGVTTEVLNGKVTVGHEVIEFQEPTAANNYTWYRKYADGWVEQGGYRNGKGAVSLLVNMANTYYTALIQSNTTGSDFHSYDLVAGSKTTSGFTILSQSTPDETLFWQVSGMAA
jgi:hypothetical protein